MEPISRTLINTPTIIPLHVIFEDKTYQYRDSLNNITR